ncbi:hypothetical protein M2322_002587 [Rhodoblastus acidophilus]|uniref:DUF2079 domain-containing protein n=1 Tax=Rhodoblastus acidophilus TaxID=1074 RepID=UPI0022255253|nr:DUF2079 domain-containing protein [Rhodoblastus acidophilus]MCW2317033.1 hypothetical protein [Rhodoblastus acidophilus]
MLKHQTILKTLSFLVPYLLVLNYDLNHYYLLGGYYWDSGEFAFYASHSTQFLVKAPALLHSEPIVRLSIHVTPFFYATSGLYQLVSALPPDAYFSLIQAVWAGLIGFCLFGVLSEVCSPWVALLIAGASAFNGPMLAALGFPHIEIAIPALSILFFYGARKGNWVLATIAFVLCLSIREDAGLHIGAVLLLLTSVNFLLAKDRADARRLLAYGVIAVLYSIAVIAIQTIYFPPETSNLSRIYLGSPPFAHVDAAFVLSQARIFLMAKGYVVLPVLVLIVWALKTRDWRLLVAPLSVTPWLTLQALAVSPGASHLSDYYGFPAILALCWPTLAPVRPRVWLQAFVSAGSILLFVTVGAFDKDMKPWAHFGPPPFAAIGRYEAVLRTEVAAARCHGRIMVDDAVAALIPERLNRAEWLHQLFVDGLRSPDAIIYMTNAYDSALTDKAIAVAGLTSRRNIVGTPFVVATAQGACASN